MQKWFVLFLQHTVVFDAILFSHNVAPARGLWLAFSPHSSNRVEVEQDPALIDILRHKTKLFLWLDEDTLAVAKHQKRQSRSRQIFARILFTLSWITKLEESFKTIFARRRNPWPKNGTIIFAGVGFVQGTVFYKYFADKRKATSKYHSVIILTFSVDHSCVLFAGQSMMG